MIEVLEPSDGNINVDSSTGRPAYYTDKELIIGLRDENDRPIEGASVFAKGAGIPNTPMVDKKDGTYTLDISGISISENTDRITIKAEHPDFEGIVVKKDVLVVRMPD